MDNILLDHPDFPKELAKQILAITNADPTFDLPVYVKYIDDICRQMLSAGRCVGNDRPARVMVTIPPQKADELLTDYLARQERQAMPQAETQGKEDVAAPEPVDEGDLGGEEESGYDGDFEESTDCEMEDDSDVPAEEDEEAGDPEDSESSAGEQK